MVRKHRTSLVPSGVSLVLTATDFRCGSADYSKQYFFSVINHGVSGENRLLDVFSFGRL